MASCRARAVAGGVTGSALPAITSVGAVMAPSAARWSMVAMASQQPA